MKIVKIACLSAALLGSTLSFAQSDDLGMYTSVEVSRKIVSKLEVSLEEEFRLRDNLNEIDRFSTALQLSYKFCPYLKAGGAYNLINYNHPTKDWEIRHRYYFFVQGSYEFNRFTISLRERFQSTYRQGVSETSTRANPKQYIRSKVALSYNIKNSSFEPYTSCEFYNSLNNKTGNGLDKIGFILGTKYKINNKNSLDLYYKYVNFDEDEDETNSHIIGIGYSHKF
jgi:Protein of unknown function (DUF2490).